MTGGRFYAFRQNFFAPKFVPEDKNKSRKMLDWLYFFEDPGFPLLTLKKVCYDLENFKIYSIKVILYKNQKANEINKAWICWERKGISNEKNRGKRD